MTSSAPFIASSEPEDGTVERWALDYVRASTLAAKLAPPAVPARFAEAAPVLHALRPGRPTELVLAEKAGKQRGFASPHGRARAMHSFFHHELQAAELFAFALLAYPTAPRAIREGFVRILHDEIRHANLYADEVRRLGYEIGAFPVRDWFWERIPRCPDVASFLATMGIGFEGGNLDHAARFARIFRDVGDASAANVQAVVSSDEVAHVRFGVTWFSALRGGLEFAAFRDALPEPLSPMLMRGAVLDREARARAGMDPRFLAELDAWRADTSSS